MNNGPKLITLTCEVDSYRSGWSVVEFLSHRFRYHPRERWVRRVAEGWVRVNGARVVPDTIVRKSDAISYTILHTEPAVDARYDVLYEDAQLLAVAKSGNIPVHACGLYIQNTLIAALKNRYGDHLNLAHRLDRETSGVVILSKDAGTAAALGRMFAAGDVSKSYTAVVHGCPTEAVFDVDAPIGKIPERMPVGPDRMAPAYLVSDLTDDLPRYVPRRRVDFENGRAARTRFRVERRAGPYAVLDAEPLSGRTNQIRVHLHHVGHPIVGDKVYGLERPSGETPPIARQALHCRVMRFAHPRTGVPLTIEAPLPADLRRLISRLEDRPA
jgi:23S rRNA-/tRNA-specific pseudouridylate synthase